MLLKIIYRYSKLLDTAAKQMPAQAQAIYYLKRFCVRFHSRISLFITNYNFIQYHISGKCKYF